MSTPVSASLGELEEFLRGGIDPVSSPSVAYGISRGTKTLLLGSTGVADKNGEILATTRTPYSLASITKPMTATALAILVDRGLVDLDAPINDYLEDGNVVAKIGNASDATVRTLANHTSGLPLHYQFFYEDEPYRPPAMAETIGRYGKLYNPPGEHYQYSNIGYGILDHLVEQVSGSSFSRFMADEVFGPLGMVSSSIGAVGNEAISYGADGVGYPRYGFDHPGASAAYCSVVDLLKFGQCHLGHGPSILSADIRKEMQRTTVINDGTVGYGVGWVTNSDRLGVHTFGHSGGMSGVNTTLLVAPEEDLVIAILVNGQSALPFRGAENALGVFVPTARELLQLEREAAPSPAVPTEIPEALRQQWVGKIETYVGDYPLQLQIQGALEATAIFQGQEFSVEGLRMSNGQLQGIIGAQLVTPDTDKRPHKLHLDLTPRGGALSGAVTAICTFEGEGGGAAGNRRGNALSFWTRVV